MRERLGRPTIPARTTTTLVPNCLVQWVTLTIIFTALTSAPTASRSSLMLNWVPSVAGKKRLMFSYRPKAQSIRSRLLSWPRIRAPCMARSRSCKPILDPFKTLLSSELVGFPFFKRGTKGNFRMRRFSCIVLVHRTWCCNHKWVRIKMFMLT